MVRVLWTGRDATIYIAGISAMCAASGRIKPRAGIEGAPKFDTCIDWYVFHRLIDISLVSYRISCTSVRESINNYVLKKNATAPQNHTHAHTYTHFYVHIYLHAHKLQVSNSIKIQLK